MIEQFSNFAVSALASACGISDTTIALSASAAVAGFPTLAANGQYRIMVRDTAVSVPEVMLVTGASGNVLTVQRGYEGSSASAHVTGAQVAHVLTAAAFLAAYPNGAIETAAGPFNFDGSLAVMEINPATPATTAVTIRTGSLVPFRIYTIADGSGNANTYPITITPDAGLINGAANVVIGGQSGIAGNNGAINFYWNGTGVRLV